MQHQPSFGRLVSEWLLASGDEVAIHILGTIGAALVLLIVWRSSQLRTHGVQQVAREPPEHVRATAGTTSELMADNTPAGEPPSVKPGVCADNFPRTRSRPGSRNSHTPVSWAELISSAPEETSAMASAPSGPSPIPSRSVTPGSVFDADFWNAVPTATPVQTPVATRPPVTMTAEADVLEQREFWNNAFKQHLQDELAIYEIGVDAPLHDEADVDNGNANEYNEGEGDALQAAAIAPHLRTDGQLCYCRRCLLLRSVRKPASQPTPRLNPKQAAQARLAQADSARAAAKAKLAKGAAKADLAKGEGRVKVALAAAAAAENANRQVAAARQAALLPSLPSPASGDGRPGEANAEVEVDSLGLHQTHIQLGFEEGTMSEAVTEVEAAACKELLRLEVASEAMSEVEAVACAESLRTPSFDLPVHCGWEQAPPSPLRPTPSPLRPACEGPFLRGFLQAVAEEHHEDHRRDEPTDEPFRRRGEASRGSERARGECDAPAIALGGSSASLPTLSSLNLQSHLSLEGEMSTAERIARWREQPRS